MKILHTADIHLREHEDERWKALKILLDVARKEEVSFFIISGDVFEKEVDAQFLRGPLRELFSNNPFKIIITSGNHDAFFYEEGIYLGEDVVMLKDFKKPFECKEVRIWALPFEEIEAKEVLERLRAMDVKDDKKNILIYHGELLDIYFSREDFGEEGQRRYMPTKLSYFKTLRFDYVLAGHFHTHFDVWEFDRGRYFVYPGSPVSVTKKEVGKRKVNIFKIGEAPREYTLDSFHFEELKIFLDPFFQIQHPLQIIEEKIRKVHPDAALLLKIAGYINSEKIKMSEAELVEEIKKALEGKAVEKIEFEFRDIKKILEDDLFLRFSEKLKKSDYENKEALLHLALRAMMEV